MFTISSKIATNNYVDQLYQDVAMTSYISSTSINLGLASLSFYGFISALLGDSAVIYVQTWSCGYTTVYQSVEVGIFTAGDVTNTVWHEISTGFYVTPGTCIVRVLLQAVNSGGGVGQNAVFDDLSLTFAQCTNPCGTNNGGCDPLTTCTPTAQCASVTCGACPGGYIGNGYSGCIVNQCINPSNPCLNGGTCATQSNGAYLCTCATGWTGSTCNTIINYCTVNGNPCQNGGSCNYCGLNCYSCTCTIDWSGTTCGTSINACLKNNGNCDPLTLCTYTNPGHTCGSCPTYYTGTGYTGCYPTPAIVAQLSPAGGVGGVSIITVTGGNFGANSSALTCLFQVNSTYMVSAPVMSGSLNSQGTQLSVLAPSSPYLPVNFISQFYLKKFNTSLSSGSVTFLFIANPNITSQNAMVSGAISGSIVEVYGHGFGNSNSSSIFFVTVGGSTATIVGGVNDTAFAIIVPALPSGLTSIVVNRYGVTSNSFPITILANVFPIVLQVAPLGILGAVGSTLTITGGGFGYDSTQLTVFLSPSPCTCTINPSTLNSIGNYFICSITYIPPYYNFTINSILNVIVERGGVNSTTSTSSQFTIIAQPVISFISPTGGISGTMVSIYGNNFGGATIPSTALSVTIGGKSCVQQPQLINSSLVICQAPAMDTNGLFGVSLSVFGVSTPTSPSPNYESISTPVLVSIYPTGGGNQTVLYLTGINLASTVINSPLVLSQYQVLLGGEYECALFDNIAGHPFTSLAASCTIPANVPPGVYSIIFSHYQVTSSLLIAPQFTYSFPPNISSIYPPAGVAGTVLTIYGSEFGSSENLLSISLGTSTTASIPCVIVTGSLNGLGTQFLCTVSSSPSPPASPSSILPIIIRRFADLYSNDDVIFRFIYPLPSLQSISPIGGGEKGGTSITISGSFIFEAVLGDVSSVSLTIGGYQCNYSDDSLSTGNSSMFDDDIYICQTPVVSLVGIQPVSMFVYGLPSIVDSAGLTFQFVTPAVITSFTAAGLSGNNFTIVFSSSSSSISYIISSSANNMNNTGIIVTIGNSLCLITAIGYNGASTTSAALTCTIPPVSNGIDYPDEYGDVYAIVTFSQFNVSGSFSPSLLGNGNLPWFQYISVPIICDIEPRGISSTGQSQTNMVTLTGRYFGGETSNNLAILLVSDKQVQVQVQSSSITSFNNGSMITFNVPSFSVGIVTVFLTRFNIQAILNGSTSNSSTCISSPQLLFVDQPVISGVSPRGGGMIPTLEPNGSYNWNNIQLPIITITGLNFYDSFENTSLTGLQAPLIFVGGEECLLNLSLWTSPSMLICTVSDQLFYSLTNTNNFTSPQDDYAEAAVVDVVISRFNGAVISDGSSSTSASFIAVTAAESDIIALSLYGGKSLMSISVYGNWSNLILPNDVSIYFTDPLTNVSLSAIVTTFDSLNKLVTVVVPSLPVNYALPAFFIVEMKLFDGSVFGGATATFEYIAIPIANSVSPAGGVPFRAVTVFGSNFPTTSSSNSLEIFFGSSTSSLPCSNVTVISNGVAICNSIPNQPSGATQISLLSYGIISSNPPLPTFNVINSFSISSIQPSGGRLSGGYTLTIIISNLVSLPSDQTDIYVMVGYGKCLISSVGKIYQSGSNQAGYSIQCIVPTYYNATTAINSLTRSSNNNNNNNTIFSQPVVVFVYGLASSFDVYFTYQQQPIITDITPSGQLAGGLITVTGYLFGDDASSIDIFIGAVGDNSNGVITIVGQQLQCTVIPSSLSYLDNFNNSGSVTCVLPSSSSSLATGWVSVVISVNGVESDSYSSSSSLATSSYDSITYISAPAEIISVSPSFVQLKHAVITIMGSNFLKQGLFINVGSKPCEKTLFVSSSEILCVGLNSATTAGNKQIVSAGNFDSVATYHTSSSTITSPMTVNVYVDAIYIKYSNPIAVAFMIIFVIIAIVIIILAFLYWKHRDVRIIKAQQPNFCFLMLFGMLLGLAGLATYFGKPSLTTCRLQIWLPSMSFVCVFGTMFAKTYRVNRIFNNKLLKRVVITDSNLLSKILLLLGIMTMILTIWEATSPSYPTLIYGNPVVLACRASSNSIGYFLIIFIFLVMIAGCYYAYQVRTVRVDYNESRYIGFTIYNILFVSFLVIPIAISTSDPYIFAAIISAGACIVLISIISALFLTRIYMLYFGEGASKKEDVIATGFSATRLSTTTNGTTTIGGGGNGKKVTKTTSNTTIIGFYNNNDFAFDDNGSTVGGASHDNLNTVAMVEFTPSSKSNKQ